MDDKTDARKYVESLPPDGHFRPGVPAWSAESMVKAFLAGQMARSLAAFDAAEPAPEGDIEEIASRLREAMPGVPIKTDGREIHIGD